jgi:hypothetical protein
VVFRGLLARSPIPGHILLQADREHRRVHVLRSPLSVRLLLGPWRRIPARSLPQLFGCDDHSPGDRLSALPLLETFNDPSINLGEKGFNRFGSSNDFRGHRGKVGSGLVNGYLLGRERGMDSLGCQCSRQSDKVLPPVFPAGRVFGERGIWVHRPDSYLHIHRGHSTSDTFSHPPDHMGRCRVDRERDKPARWLQPISQVVRSHKFMVHFGSQRAPKHHTVRAPVLSDDRVLPYGRGDGLPFKRLVRVGGAGFPHRYRGQWVCLLPVERSGEGLLFWHF